MLNHSHLPSNVACDGVCDCGTKRARTTLGGQWRGRQANRTVCYRESCKTKKKGAVKTWQSSKHQAGDARRVVLRCGWRGEGRKNRGGNEIVGDGKRPDWPCGPRTPEGWGKETEQPGGWGGGPTPPSHLDCTEQEDVR